MSIHPSDIPALEAALEAARTPAERVPALVDLARGLLIVGQLDRGQAVAAEARELARTVGDDLNLYRALYYTAHLFLRGSNFHDGRTFLMESLELAERQGRADFQAQSLDGLGSAHQQLGELTDALSYFGRSLELHKQVNQPVRLATTLSNLANVYDDLEDYEHAKVLREECVALERGHRSPSL